MEPQDTPLQKIEEKVELGLDEMIELEQKSIFESKTTLTIIIVVLLAAVIAVYLISK
jgi:hypothetical protein